MNLRDLRSVAGALLGTRELVILSFIIGLLIGWLVIGWLIWPLQWEDAAPADLQADYRQLYLTTVARAYAQDPTLNLQAVLGTQDWSDEQLQEDLSQAYQEAAPADQAPLQALASALGVDIAPAVVEEGGGRTLGGVIAVFFIVLVGAVGLFVLWRLSQQGVRRPAAAGAERTRPLAARTEWAAEETPLAQFVTSYSIGEDYYDQSFSIETPTGEFLGECGVGISEAIGVGDPKKVTAFEVWLFDKNDIRTVTKVLMSEHAFQDDALRAKLAPKGEAMLANEGTVVSLETASLRVEAKVIELEYGEGELPANSFVTRLTIELAAWQLERPAEPEDTLSDVNWEA